MSLALKNAQEKLNVKSWCKWLLLAFLFVWSLIFLFKEKVEEDVHLFLTFSETW